MRKVIAIVSLIVLVTSGWFGPLTAFAATGAPKILSLQGRLLDSAGNLLGGTGTNYCFRFSIYTDATVGAPDTKLWPAGTPSKMTVNVVSGVYNVNIGDTSAGGDLLDFDFNTTDTAFLNIEAGNQVSGSCAGATFENLSPRQRIASLGYALNANTLDGFTASQSATGNQIPVLTGGDLTLGDTNPNIGATGTNTLTIQGTGGTGNIQFFGSSNTLSSVGDLTLAGDITADGEYFAGTSNIQLTNSDGYILPAAILDDGTFARVGVAETVTGGWTFNTNPTTFDTAIDVNAASTMEGLTIDGAGTLTVNNLATFNDDLDVVGGDILLHSNAIITSATSISSTELDRLDGHDAPLVDTNDSVSTAITGTGTLGSGSITTSFGSIDTGSDSIVTTGIMGSAGSTTFTGNTGTFSGAIAANGGITFDNATDTIGAHRLSGTEDANTNLIINIGNTGTDFTSSGGLTLAGDLTLSSDAGIGILGGGLTDCDTSSTSKLLWDATTHKFSCGTDQNTGGGGGASEFRESDGTPDLTSMSVLEFGPGTTSSDEFIVSDQGSGVARVRIGDEVGMLNQAETVTGGWTFNTATTTFNGDTNFNGTNTFASLDLTGDLTLGTNNIITGATTISSTELDRLDGHDAALVDVNDAVTTAITGTGALTSGSIGSGFGTISTGNTITTTGTIGTAGTTTFTGGTATFSGAIAANGGITFDNSTDTVGAFTAAGTIDMANNVITNIGDAGTDFGAGGTLAMGGDLTLSADAGEGLVGGGLADCDTAGTSKLLWDATTHKFSCGTDQNSGTSTAWDVIADPAGNGSVAMAQTTQTLDWNMASDANLDALSVTLNNDVAGSNVQRALVVQNIDDGGAAGVTERLLVLDNADTNEAVTTALEISSAAGTIGTAIDASDSDIVTALAIGDNQITGGSGAIDFTNFDLASTGAVTLTGNLALSGDASEGLSGGGLTDCDTAATSKLLWDATTNKFSCGSDQNSGTATNLNDIGDATANGSVAVNEFTQSWDWNTNSVAAGAFDGMTFSITNDGVLDTNTQRLMVLKNSDDGGLTGTTERLLVLDNADTNEAVTTALEIVSSGGGAVTTAIDASDADIVTALAIGDNQITGGSGVIDFTNFDLASTGAVTLTGDLNLSGDAGEGVLGGGLTDCDTAGTSKLLWDATTHKFSCGSDQNSGTATNLNDIGDATANGSVAVNQFTQSWDWNTADTAAAFDGMTFTITNDASTDASAQRAVVIQNNSATGGTTENLLVLANADNSAVTTGLQIVGTSTGAITTAIDASDAEIGTALAIGSNDITTGATTISSAELDLLDGHDAALVDTNDAVNTAITGTGALDAGSITSNFGSINVGADTITTSGTIGTAATTTFTGAGATFTGSIAANGGIVVGANQDITFTSGTGSLVMTNSQTVSDSIVNITPAFASTTTAQTYNVFNVAAFSPTNTTGTDTVNGFKLGNLTDPGAAITSNAINIGSGWDTAINDNGTLLSSTEIDRLDGKDAALVDTNDAVNTAITGTGTLTSGSIASGFGTISTTNTITTTGTVGTAGTTTFTGAGATFTSAVAANGGITFDNSTDTISAFTAAGDIDMNSSFIVKNIGNAGTDFDTSGGLTLAGLETANGGITIGANQDVTFNSGTGSLVMTNSVSNASDNVIDLAPAFAGGATDALAYNVINIAAFAPTNGAGTDTVTGVKIGNLTDPGATITSNAITIGSGWDTAINDNGTAISSAELDLLDGHDAALVDTNDAVSTAITGTGALNSGSITSGFGSIDTGSDSIVTTGTMGSAGNTAFTGSTLTLSGTGTFNSDVVIGNAATDALTVNSEIRNFSGNNALEFEGATNDNIYTIFAVTDPTVSSKTVTFQNASGTVAYLSDTISPNLTDNVTDALDIQEGTNNYININTTNAAENISFGNATTNPSFSFLGSGTTTHSGALTVNGATTLTPGSTSDVVVNGDADSNFQIASTIGSDVNVNVADITITASGTGSTNTLNGLAITNANAGGTETPDSLLFLTSLDTDETVTNGAFIEQNATGGTMTNGIQIKQTAGTLTNAINIQGTVGNMLNSSSIVIDGAGAITGATGVSTTTLTASGAIAANGGSITSTSATLTIDAGGTVKFNDATIDLTNQATSFSILDNSATALAIKEGSNNYLLVNTTNGSEIMTLGATVAASATNIQSGTGNIDFQVAGTGATGIVQIGSTTASGTPDVLVLDNGNATATTNETSMTTNGSMYYNSNAGKFRCRENGTWKDCDTNSGGSPRLDQIAAATTTATIANANNAIVWNWGTLTTETGMTFGGGSAMTTGTIFALGPATYTHTTAETGSAQTITLSDTSTNTSGNSITNGLSIASTINTSGAGTKAINSLNVSAATLTACASGACTWDGLKVSTQATGAASTITQNGLEVNAAGIAAGSLNGLKIGNITAGAGTETALNIGSGWDTDLKFADATPTIEIPDPASQNSNQLAINDSAGNNLLALRDMGNGNNTFGSAATAGAFIDRNSFWSEEYNAFRAGNCTADALQARGDGNPDNACTAQTGQMTVENTLVGAGGSTQASSLADTVNGIEQIRSVSGAGIGRTSGTLETLGTATAFDNQNIFHADNLPLVTMKVKPEAVSTNDRTFVGLGTLTLGSVTPPTDGLYFSNCTDTTCTTVSTNWQANMMSGGSITNIDCGVAIDTSNYAFLRIEVRKSGTAGNSDVHFYVDGNVSNGITETECGTGTTAATPTVAMTAMLDVGANSPTAATHTTNLDIDYIRVWQDDSETTSAETPVGSLVAVEDVSTEPVVATDDSATASVDINTFQTLTIEGALTVGGDVTIGGSLAAGSIVTQHLEAPELATLTDQFAAMGLSLDGVGSQVATLASALDTMNASLLALTSRVDAIEAGTNATAFDLTAPTISGGLTVNGLTTLGGGLLVDSIGSIGDMLSIQSDVAFIGRPYVNSDTAGFAHVAFGDRSVRVDFDDPYLSTPIVTATVSQAHQEDGQQQVEAENLILSNDISYIVTDVDDTGFSILLSRNAPADMTFSWIALAVQDAHTFDSMPAPIVAPEPIVEEAPAAPVEETAPSDTTASTDVPTDSVSDSSDVTADASDDDTAVLSSDTTATDTTADSTPTDATADTTTDAPVVADALPETTVTSDPVEASAPAPDASASDSSSFSDTEPSA